MRKAVGCVGGLCDRVTVQRLTLIRFRHWASIERIVERLCTCGCIERGVTGRESLSCKTCVRDKQQRQQVVGAGDGRRDRAATVPAHQKHLDHSTRSQKDEVRMYLSVCV